MEIIINFKDGTQAITDNWTKAENYYKSVLSNITTIFINDELVYNWSTGLDSFLSFTPIAFVKKAGIKDTQNTTKAPIFTYCKVNKDAIEALALRALYGHERYNKDGADHDWKNFTRVPNGDFEYSNAMFRHALGVGEDSEFEHIVSVAWNAVARLQIYLMDKDENNKNSNK